MRGAECVFFAACLAAVQAGPLEDWRRTVERMHARKCAPPLTLTYALEAFREAEEIEPALGPEELGDLYPPWIVVQRCTSTSGCCKPKYVCGVKDTEHTTMTYFHKKYKTFHKIRVKNHTKCMCRVLRDMPK